jgi:ribosome biogenesis protein BMS1
VLASLRSPRFARRPRYLEALKREKEAKQKDAWVEFGAEGEEQRTKHEGFRQGLYVRVEIDRVPVDFLNNYSPNTPLILGGLLESETQMGLLRARFKKHRWHKKILKNMDPLVFSIGWRRYQSVPLLSTEDQNDRHRYLKYTPEHMHCFVTFYGPLTAPNTGLLAIKNMTGKISGFR